MCGIALPPGLRESDALPEPIFTPATKAQTGHDENISFERMASIVGEELPHAAARSDAQDLPASCRITRGRAALFIADTKFEFGMVDGEMMLADEVLTPDSSRFWPVDTYQARRPAAFLR